MREPAPGHLRVLAHPARIMEDGNPYVLSLYAEVRALGAQVDHFDRWALLDDYDIVHVHWPDYLVRWSDRSAPYDCVKVLFGIWFARRRGARLVWTGHDLAPHEMPRPLLYRAYSKAFIRMVDLLISLGPAATIALRQAYPALAGTPVRVIRHGHYRHAYPSSTGDVQARAALKIASPKPLLLLLGEIRRYKNPVELVDRFRAVMADDADLAVVGAVRNDPRLAGEVLAAAEGCTSVTVRIGRVPSRDIATWHAAADVVVLPYAQSTSLHSGAALLALSLNTPIVVRDSGTMRELRDLAGPQWVYLFDGDVTEALRVARIALDDRRPDEVDLSELDWTRLGEQTMDAYRSILPARVAPSTRLAAFAIAQRWLGWLRPATR
jgi:beta-1,4-mannosyltransferase